MSSIETRQAIGIQYFLHIPKTAGSTFLEIARDQFAYYETFEFRSHLIKWDLNTYMNIPAEEKHKFRLVYGHFPFGIHPMNGPHFNYLTFLRHPIKRILSEYNHISGHQHGMNYSGYMHKSINEFLDSSQYHDNKYVRLLSGNNTVNIIHGSEPVTAKDYEQAKLNMDTFFPVIGITERFNESLALISKTYSWKVRPFISRRVSKVPIPEINPTLELQLKEDNKYDLMIYNDCVQKLESQIQQMGHDAVNQLVTTFTRPGWKTRIKAWLGGNY